MQLHLDNYQVDGQYEHLPQLLVTDPIIILLLFGKIIRINMV